MKLYFRATLWMISTSIVAIFVSQFLSLANVLLVFFMGVLITAATTSVGPAVWSAILGFLGYNFFFAEPHYTFRMIEKQEIFTILFFLFISIITGNLAARLRQKISALQNNQTIIQSLLTLSRKISAAPDEETIIKISSEHIKEIFNVDTFFIQHESNHSHHELTCVYQSNNNFSINLSDSKILNAATSSWENKKSLGWVKDFHEFWFIPIFSDIRVYKLLVIFKNESSPTPDELHQMEALSKQIAQALERSQLVTDLEESKIQGETEQLRSALLTSVSHDLRTPLTTMIGAISSLIQYDEKISLTDKKELLKSTLNEAERLNRYIQNLLDMTRLGYGELKLNRDWISLEDLINSAMSRLHTLLTPFILKIDIDPSVPLLYAHGAFLEQALVNILENAVKFSPPQGKILLNAYTSDNKVYLELSDEGPGIPLEDQDKVFHMFYSVSKGDRHQGTGLGLAICKGMIGAHGGEISVIKNSYGQGTCIRIQLPLNIQPNIPDDYEI